MFKKVLITIFFLIVLVSVAFAWRYYEIRKNEDRLRLAREAANQTLVATQTAPLPTVTASTSAASLYETAIQHKTDMFNFVSINAGDTVITGTVVKGEVRGGWYFEGVFPVVLKDMSGNTLWQGGALAQSDWMTTNFVPFTFTPVYTPFGTPTNAILVLKKDNPSGEPINDDELQIPVKLQ